MAANEIMGVNQTETQLAELLATAEKAEILSRTPKQKIQRERIEKIGKISSGGVKLGIFNPYPLPHRPWPYTFPILQRIIKFPSLIVA